MADEITNDDIVDAALEPAEAEADGVRAKSRPISELLAAADRAAGVTAVSGGSAWGAALRPARLVPPG